MKYQFYICSAPCLSARLDVTHRFSWLKKFAVYMSLRWESANALDRCRRVLMMCFHPDSFLQAPYKLSGGDEKEGGRGEEGFHGE